MDIQEFLDENFDVSQRTIETKYGTIYLSLVKDRIKLIKNISPILISKNKFSEELFNVDKEKKLWNIFEERHIFDFFTMVRDYKFKVFNLYEYYMSIRKAFEYVFKDDIFDKIENADDYDFLVELICKVNGINLTKKSKNDEIAYFDTLEQEYNESKYGKIDFESVYTTVWAFTGYCPDEMTLYQLNAIFARITMLKSHDMSVSISIASGKSNIIPYYTIIEKVEKEKTISMKEIKNYKELKI